MLIDICVGIRTSMGVIVGTGMCVGNAQWHVYRHVYRNVYRHVYKNVYRHVCRHVYRHMYKHVYRPVWPGREALQLSLPLHLTPGWRCRWMTAQRAMIVPYRLYLGMADGMSVARVLVCRTQNSRLIFSTGTPIPAQWSCRRPCRNRADIEPTTLTAPPPAVWLGGGDAVG